MYRSVLDIENAARLRQLVQSQKIDVVTFTSGSAVNYFVQTVNLKNRVVIAVIGPSTASTARAHGLEVDIEADSHTVPGLVTAILNYYAARRGTLEV
jgi:uroporphyrinogen-III synthase